MRQMIVLENITHKDLDSVIEKYELRDSSIDYSLQDDTELLIAFDVFEKKYIIVPPYALSTYSPMRKDECVVYDFEKNELEDFVNHTKKIMLGISSDSLPFKFLKSAQYHLDTRCKSNIISDRLLVFNLIKDGYHIFYKNMTIEEFVDSNAPAITIDTDEKTISFSNTTCAASYVSHFGYEPIDSKTFLMFYDDFIIKKNKTKYSNVCYLYTLFAYPYVRELINQLQKIWKN